MRTPWMRLSASLGATLLLATGCASSAASEQERATARIHYDLGVTSLNRGDPRGALRELLVAVDKDPKLAQAHNALGLVYHSLDRSDDALEHYEKAVEAKPEFSEAYNNMGTLLTDLGRYDEAVVAFKKAMGDILYATPWIAEGNMGWAYYKSGQKELGLKHLRNAVAVNPKFCRGYEWLARVGLETNDGEQVVSNCARFEKYCAADKDIVQQIPDDYVREMRYYMALGHLKTGNREAAKEALAQCAEGDGDGYAARCRESLATLQ